MVLLPHRERLRPRQRQAVQRHDGDLLAFAGSLPRDEREVLGSRVLVQLGRRVAVFVLVVIVVVAVVVVIVVQIAVDVAAQLDGGL